MLSINLRPAPYSSATEFRLANDLDVPGPVVPARLEGGNKPRPVDRPGPRPQGEVFVAEVVAQVGAEDARSELGRDQIKIFFAGPGVAGVEVEAEGIRPQVLAQPQEAVDPAHDGSWKNFQRHAPARILDHRQEPAHFRRRSVQKERGNRPCLSGRSSEGRQRNGHNPALVKKIYNFKHRLHLSRLPHLKQDFAGRQSLRA